MDQAAPEAILVVCTGNVCRSQLAAYLIERDLAKAWPAPVRVRSAGLGAARDTVVCRLVRDRLAEGAAALPRVRDLKPELLSRSSLILTATCEHRSQVGQLDREARARTFTLVEAAEILSHQPAPGQARPSMPLGTLADLATEMNARRPLIPDPRFGRSSRSVRQPTVWDIADGHFSGRWRHRQTLAEVERVVGRLRQGLALARRTWARET